jgi:hypothetical protein
MTEIIGACGLACHECPGYLATQANDAARIAAVAKQWSKEFGEEIKPEYVWCDGCLTAGARKCRHTAECEIRACVVGRGVPHCAACADYGCEKVVRFLKQIPEAKERLDRLRGV